MGRRRRRSGTDLDGVLVLDKPAGPTSHDVVQQVRRAVGQHRVGHTGTLDPAATGVLVVCLGRATRLVRFLQAGRKTYAARMVLGVETSSQDADGEVVATRPAGHLDEASVCEALLRFQGELQQVPPMVSAVRVDGERLHVRARRGEEVAREPRAVTVYELVLDGFTPGEQPEASFLVTCSAGTYVRTLAHDVGQALGVGASLTGLRRLANGPFTAVEAHPVADLAGGDRAAVAARCLTADAAIARSLPTVTVSDPAEVLALTRGGRLARALPDGDHAVYVGERLIGIYRDAGGQARPELVWLRPEERGQE